MTPLRERMTDDLLLRNYSDRTIKAYLRCVRNFARYFRKSPDELGPPHIREYQLYLVKQKQCSWAVFNQTVCALRFFYNTTLGCKEMIEEIPYPRFEKRVPVVLSQTEVAALLQAVKNLKHRTLLTTIYATGLRVSEATNLLVTDIDSSRMIVQVRQGKGRKDRFVMLSPNLLTLLREYWKAYHPRHWLFPGQNPSRPINNATAYRISQQAAGAAKLSKSISPHTLRRWAIARPFSVDRLPERILSASQGAQSFIPREVCCLSQSCKRARPSGLSRPIETSGRRRSLCEFVE